MMNLKDLGKAIEQVAEEKGLAAEKVLDAVEAAIEQAILKSDLGITPQNDGKILRLVLPSPTTERRKELIKVVKKQAEEYRVAVRNLRRDSVEELKKQEKEKKISKDDLFKLEAQIQKLTDHTIHQIEGLLSAKEKEILEG